MAESKQGRSCADYREDIPWYVNGTLADPAAGRLEQHLSNCGECRSDLELHSEIRDSVLRRDLTPMIPTTRAEDILSTDGNSGASAQRLPQRWSQVLAIAAGLAILGVALVLGLYPEVSMKSENQVFETATSIGTPDGLDYVLQLNFEENIAAADRARIAEKLDGAIKWAIDDRGTYDVHVRLESPTLEELREYEEQAEALAGVESAKFTALQLPMR